MRNKKKKMGSSGLSVEKRCCEGAKQFAMTKLRMCVRVRHPVDMKPIAEHRMPGERKGSVTLLCGDPYTSVPAYWTSITAASLPEYLLLLFDESVAASDSKALTAFAIDCVTWQMHYVQLPYSYDFEWAPVFGEPIVRRNLKGGELRGALPKMLDGFLEQLEERETPS